jgi:hypothetical protein
MKLRSQLAQIGSSGGSLNKVVRSQLPLKQGLTSITEANKTSVFHGISHLNPTQQSDL